MPSYFDQYYVWYAMDIKIDTHSFYWIDTSLSFKLPNILMKPTKNKKIYFVPGFESTVVFRTTAHLMYYSLLYL